MEVNREPGGTHGTIHSSVCRRSALRWLQFHGHSRCRDPTGLKIPANISPLKSYFESAAHLDAGRCCGDAQVRRLAELHYSDVWNVIRCGAAQGRVTCP
jgi:hypothetical protein